MTSSSYSLTSKYFVLNDRPKFSQDLGALFRDAHTLFSLRVRELGTHSKILTSNDTHALRVMLEALITTKEYLQNQDREA